MFRILATVIAVLAMSAPAWAADQELAIFQDVSRQVQQYSRYTGLINTSGSFLGPASWSPGRLQSEAS